MLTGRGQSSASGIEVSYLAIKCLAYEVVVFDLLCDFVETKF